MFFVLEKYFKYSTALKKTNFESVDKKGDTDCSIQERKKWLKVQKDWILKINISHIFCLFLVSCC